MQVIVDENRIIDCVPDWVEVVLQPGQRIENLDDSYVFEHDLWDYVWNDGPVYVEPEQEPLQPYEVLKAIYTAMPTLTVGVIDSIALRMRPYLPDYDQSQTYTIGTLVIKDGDVQRRTIGGWRKVEP